MAGKKYEDLVTEHGDLKPKSEILEMLKNPNDVYKTLLELKGLIRASARETKVLRSGDWGGPTTIEEEIVRAQKAHDDMIERRRMRGTDDGS